MTHTIINPESLGEPRGWNNGLLAPAGGRVLFVAGQDASDASGKVEPAGFVEQFARALDKVLTVVRASGGGPENVMRLTIFVTDVAAGAERAPRARKDDRTHARLPVESAEGVTQLCVDLERQRVQPVGSVQRDRGDRRRGVVLVEKRTGGERHAGSPSFGLGLERAHRHPEPPRTAVASISMVAFGSTSPRTSTSAIAG